MRYILYEKFYTVSHGLDVIGIIEANSLGEAERKYKEYCQSKHPTPRHWGGVCFERVDMLEKGLMVCS